MSRPKLFIATCEEKPQLAIADRLLVQELQSLGLEPQVLIWSEPASSLQSGDFVLLRSVWDYHLRCQEFRLWLQNLARQGIQIINAAPTVNWNIDKSYLLALAAKGVAIVPTQLFSQRQETAPEFVDGKTYVVKPTISAGAHKTFRGKSADPEMSRFLSSILAHSDALIQEYIESIESAGEVSLIFFADTDSQITFSHAVIKKPRHGDFRVQSDFGSSIVPFKAEPELIDLGQGILAHVPEGRWTYARVDLVDWQHQPLLMELELIEPDLFLNLEATAAPRFAKIILDVFSRGSSSESSD